MEDLIFVKKLRGGSFEAKSNAKMRNSRNILMLIRNKVRKGLNELKAQFFHNVLFISTFIQNLTL